jgi:hypothetical protein
MFIFNINGVTMKIEKIIQYENGELNMNETIKLFSELIKSGIVWQLQGSYGRTAMDLIDSGYLDIHGNILIDV